MDMFVGSYGVFRFKPPFDKHNTDIGLKVISIRSISELESSGYDVKSELYTKNALNSGFYDSAVAINESIVTFEQGTGVNISVPNSYISSIPMLDGIEYKAGVIGINVGILKKSTNLAPVFTSLTEVIKDALGVVPELRFVETETSIFLSKDDSSDLDAARNAVMASSSFSLDEHARLLEETAAMRIHIASLEAFILRKMNGCLDDCSGTETPVPPVIIDNASDDEDSYDVCPPYSFQDPGLYYLKGENYYREFGKNA